GSFPADLSLPHSRRTAAHTRKAVESAGNGPRIHANLLLMSQDLKTAVILNPRAAAGRAGRQWPEIQRALHDALGGYALFRTERSAHATELVRTALQDGYERVVSVGGDGT